MANKTIKKDDSIEEEDVFDLTDILDPSYPLLRMLKDLCPGTFKHSQSVAAIVEAVCISIGIDPLKPRIAAMLHDIGKTRNPKLFTENQLADDIDPHETIDPHISAQLIIKHVADSVAILVSDQNIPRDIIMMVSQHHGNGITKFFFDKSGDTSEEQFRYNMPVPNTPEGAVLMICDIVEAASRSNFQSGTLEIKELIDKIFFELTNDHQFDEIESDWRIQVDKLELKWGMQKEIKESLIHGLRKSFQETIKKTLITELQGIFQKRVDYSKAKK